MTLEEIKSAVLAGKTVHWASSLYVVENYGEQWLVRCTHNNSCVGLTWADGVTLSDAPFTFYIAGEMKPPTRRQMDSKARLRDYTEKKRRAGL